VFHPIPDASSEILLKAMTHILQPKDLRRMVNMSIKGKTDAEIAQHFNVSHQSISRWLNDPIKLAFLTDLERDKLEIARKSRRPQRPYLLVDTKLVEITKGVTDGKLKEYSVSRRSYSGGRSWYASENATSKPWKANDLEVAIFALLGLHNAMKDDDVRVYLRDFVERIELTMAQRGTHRDVLKLRDEILRLSETDDRNVFGQRRHKLNADFWFLVEKLKQTPLPVGLKPFIPIDIGSDVTFENRKKQHSARPGINPTAIEEPIGAKELLLRCVNLWETYLKIMRLSGNPSWLQRLSTGDKERHITNDSPGRAIRIVWRGLKSPGSQEKAVSAEIEPDGQISTHTAEFLNGGSETSIAKAIKAEARRKNRLQR